MAFKDIINTILPPINGVSAYEKSPFLSTTRPRGSSTPHGGYDFNYVGRQSSPLNRNDPVV